MVRWVLIAAALLAGAAAIVHGAEDYVLHVMKGRLAAVDAAHRTAVVEVPRNGDAFTVGGPLVSGAMLRRNGRPVDLAAFEIGEKVTVRWRHTPRGHLIEALTAR